MTNGSNGECEGNTKTPRIPQKINWFFTFNNYTLSNIDELIKKFNTICKKYCFQEEQGKEGTKHLQGVITLNKKMRWSEFNLPKSIHWEGVKDINKSYDYCSKDDTRVGKMYTKNYTKPKPIKIIENLYDWQQKIVDIITSLPDGRSVHWYYDEIGNKGKSALCKYLYVKHNSLIIQGGKLNDIMNIIFNSNMDIITSVIIDIPRNNKNKVSYSAIECILNGMITNTKFETGIKVFNPPHVIVLSNSYPEYTKLSSDRWKITNLNPIEFDDDN